MPPVEDGALHDRTTCVFPDTPTTDCAAEGAVLGTTELEEEDGRPVPAKFLALTLNTYPVPLTRPVTVTEAVVETESAKVIHVVPLFVEYSTT